MVHERPNVLSTVSTGIEAALLAITVLLAVIAALASVRKVIPRSRSRSGRTILNACMVAVSAFNLVTDAALDETAFVTVRVLVAVHTARVPAPVAFLKKIR